MSDADDYLVLTEVGFRVIANSAEQAKQLAKEKLELFEKADNMAWKLGLFPSPEDENVQIANIGVSMIFSPENETETDDQLELFGEIDNA